jgi:hypothetical protein
MSDSTGTILDGMSETLKQAAETVRAADDLISAVSNLVPTDSRSIVVEVNNLTKHTLSHVTDNFNHGGFGPTLPQGLIRPMQTDVFSVISDGIATGVEGSLTYLSDGIDGLLVGFDNPFLGGNSANVVVSTSLSPELSLVSAISTGNRSHARYVLFPKDLSNLSTTKIGFNPEDRFMVTIGNTLAVVTNDGSVFGCNVNGPILGPLFQFSGPKIGFNPEDRFMVTIGNTLAVVTQDGSVFGCNVNGPILGPLFQFSGPKIGFNPGDRFMVTIGNTLAVVTQDGSVFGSNVDGSTLGPLFQFI